MKDLRLEERFAIETDEIGVHTFDVYVEHKDVIYFIEGMSIVKEDDYYLELDTVYSGVDCEHIHIEEVLLEGLKNALWERIFKSK